MNTSITKFSIENKNLNIYPHIKQHLSTKMITFVTLIDKKLN